MTTCNRKNIFCGLHTQLLSHDKALSASYNVQFFFIPPVIRVRMISAYLCCQRLQSAKFIQTVDVYRWECKRGRDPSLAVAVQPTKTDGTRRGCHVFFFDSFFGFFCGIGWKHLWKIGNLKRSMHVGLIMLSHTHLQTNHLDSAHGGFCKWGSP